MAATRIISIIGRKNAGKTTLTVALASELARRGHRVMSMKHADHPAQVDQPGVDSWRHFHEGRAERVLLVSPEMRVLFHRAPDEYDPIGLVREHLSGAFDLVRVMELPFIIREHARKFQFSHSQTSLWRRLS